MPLMVRARLSKKEGALQPQITVSSSSTKPVVLSSTSSNYLTVTTTGTISAAGSYAVYAPVAIVATIANAGSIAALNGYAIRLEGGGSVTNGSASDPRASIIGGSYGIRFDSGYGSVTNFGTISGGLTSKVQTAGILLGGNGYVVNGSAADTSALIAGTGTGVRATGTAVSIANFGTILASAATSYGIYLRAGGSITNGSAGDDAALIRGYELGIQTTTDGATVVNFGTVQAFSTLQSFGRAVHLSAGGTVINGSNADTIASMTGAEGGVYIKGPSNHGAAGTSPSTVLNYGTITGANVAAIYIRLGNRAVVVNGSTSDTNARIDGGSLGVSIQGLTAASVTNFGTITAASSTGVYLIGGGVVVNGAATDQNALIQGTLGVCFGGSVGSTVINWGTVASKSGSTQAVRLTAGGTVVNGGATAAKALLSGGVVVVGGVGTVSNFGTIVGNTGVAFYRGLNALVTQTGSGTVVNSGMIESSSGISGTAIRFGYGAEKLVADPGSTIIGKVVGGSGSNTLELAAGTGNASIGSIGSSFTKFGSLMVDSGASWTLTGSNSLSAGGGATLAGGATLEVQGNLTASSLTMLGTGSAIMLSGPAALSAQIGDFSAGEAIDITSGTVTGLNFYGGLLTLSNGSGVMGTLQFSGAGLTKSSFATRSDGNGGTDIIPAGLPSPVGPVGGSVISQGYVGESFIALLKSAMIDPQSAISDQRNPGFAASSQQTSVFDSSMALSSSLQHHGVSIPR